MSSVAIDLLKQLKEKDEMSTYMVVDLVFLFELLGIRIPNGLPISAV